LASPSHARPPKGTLPVWHAVLLMHKGARLWLGAAAAAAAAAASIAAAALFVKVMPRILSVGSIGKPPRLAGGELGWLPTACHTGRMMD